MSLLPHLILAEYSIPHGLTLFVVFGLAGILMAIIGYKLFDKMTPGDLHAEIFEHKNVAAAILAGSVIIGVSLILAAAMSS
jgi:putative membrane protein